MIRMVPLSQCAKWLLERKNIKFAIHIYTPWWRDALWEWSVLPKNTTLCPWPQFKPGLLPLEASTLTTRPQCKQYCNKGRHACRFDSKGNKSHMSIPTKQQVLAYITVYDWLSSSIPILILRCWDDFEGSQSVGMADIISRARSATCSAW